MHFKWPASISISQKTYKEFENTCKLIECTKLSKVPNYDYRRSQFEEDLLNDWIRCLDNASKKCNQYQQLKKFVYQMLYDTKLVEKNQHLAFNQLMLRAEGLSNYIKEIVTVEEQIGEMREILSSLKQLQTSSLVKTQDRIRKSTLKQADKVLLKEITLIKQRLNQCLETLKTQQIPKNVTTATIRMPRRQQGLNQQALPEKERKQRQKLQKQHDDNRKRLKGVMDSLKDMLASNIPQLQRLNQHVWNQQNLLIDDKNLLFEIVNNQMKFRRLQQKLSKSPQGIQIQARKSIGSNSKAGIQVVKVLQKEKEVLYKGQNNQKYEKLQLLADKLTKQNEQLKKYISHNQRQMSDLKSANETLKRELSQIKNKWQKAKQVTIPKAQKNSISQSKLAQLQKEYQQKLKNMRINERKLRSSYAALEQMIEPLKQEAARLFSQLYKSKTDLEQNSKAAYDYQRLQQDHDKLRKYYQLLLGGNQGEFVAITSKDVANSSQSTKDLQMIKLRQELNMKDITLAAVSQKFKEAITSKQQKITSLQLSIQQLRIKLRNNEWSHTALPK